MGNPFLPALTTHNMCAQGADTTSTVMSILFYLLVRNPDKYRRLQAEVDLNFPGDQDPFETGKLAVMPFLNAVM